jgi:hypothetical protein
MGFQLVKQSDAKERLTIIEKDIENSTMRLRELHDAREARLFFWRAKPSESPYSG